MPRFSIVLALFWVVGFGKLAIASTDVVTGYGLTVDDAKADAALICQAEEGILTDDGVQGVGSDDRFFQYTTVCIPGPGSALAEDDVTNRGGYAEPSQSRDEYCQNAKQPGYFKTLLYATNNQIAFVNPAGPLDTGLCWWHSMFQRNAAYLTVFRPDLPKPSHSEALALINDIITRSGIVEIPGYQNLSQFTSDYQNETTNALATWQIVDGVIFGGWTRDIGSKKDLLGDHLAGAMKDFYQNTEVDQRVSFALLVPNEIGSHAWLILNVLRTVDGYALDILDSNFLGVQRRYYHAGMEQLPFLGKETATLDLDRNWLDFQAYENARENYCERGLTSRDFRN
jgi:hypothetical protein